MIDAPGCIERTVCKGAAPGESPFSRRAGVVYDILFERRDQSVAFEPYFYMRIALLTRGIVIMSSFVRAPNRPTRSFGKKRRYHLGTAVHPVAVFAALKQGFAIELVVGDVVHGAQFKGTPGLIKKAVWSCIQEAPVEFEGYELCDPGAYPEPPLSGKITKRVMEPWRQPKDDKERKAVQKLQKMVEKLRKRNTGSQ